MKAQIKKLTAMGYDTAIKTWTNDYNEKGFFLMAWKPGQVKQTTVSLYHQQPVDGLRQLIQMAKDKEKEVKDGNGKSLKTR